MHAIQRQVGSVRASPVAFRAPARQAVRASSSSAHQQAHQEQQRVASKRQLLGAAAAVAAAVAVGASPLPALAADEPAVTNKARFAGLAMTCNKPAAQVVVTAAL